MVEKIAYANRVHEWLSINSTPRRHNFCNSHSSVQITRNEHFLKNFLEHISDIVTQLNTF